MQLKIVPMEKCQWMMIKLASVKASVTKSLTLTNLVIIERPNITTTYNRSWLVTSPWVGHSRRMLCRPASVTRHDKQNLKFIRFCKTSFTFKHKNLQFCVSFALLSSSVNVAQCASFTFFSKALTNTKFWSLITSVWLSIAFHIQFELADTTNSILFHKNLNER